MEWISIGIAGVGLLISVLSVIVALNIKRNTATQVYVTEQIKRYNDLYCWYKNIELDILYATMIEANWYLMYKDVDGFENGIKEEERNFTNFSIPENATLVTIKENEIVERLELLLGAQFVGTNDNKGVNEYCGAFAVISSQVRDFEKKIREINNDIFIESDLKNTFNEFIEYTNFLGSKIVGMNRQLIELDKKMNLIKISPNYISLIKTEEVINLRKVINDKVINSFQQQINKWK